MKSSHTSEGAVAVIVAICLLLIFGLGAIAIDLGGAWQTKRALVVDTDAAALAGAQELAGDCDNLSLAIAKARHVFRSNHPSSAAIPDANIAVDPLPSTTDCQALRVSYIETVDTPFAAANGRPTIDVHAASTATTSTGLNVDDGVRPFALCSGDELVKHFLDDDEPVQKDALQDQDILLDETWKNSGTCGGASANRGWFCFDENCGTETIRGLLTSGYSQLDLGNETDEPDCDSTSTGSDDCVTKPGATGNSLTNKDEDGLLPLVCQNRADDDCIIFPILVLDSWAKKGGRTEAEPYGVLYVRLMGWCVNKKDGGSPPGTCTSNDMGLRLDVLGLQTQGVPGDWQYASATRTWICDIDHNSVSSTCEFD